MELQVHHYWRKRENRPWKSELATGYPNRWMKTTLGIDWHLLRLALTEKESMFIIGDWGHLAALALFVARILRRYPVALYADTPQEQLPRPLVKRWVRQRLLGWLLPRLDAIFTGKPGGRVVVEMGARPESIVELTLFVNLDRPETAAADPTFSTQAAGFREMIGCGPDDNLHLIVGQLTYKKGVDIALRAFADCLKQTATAPKLLIAGDGPLRQELEALIDTLGLTQSVRILGWLEPDEIDALYMAADVLIHPARWDPYPLVILESMSWGLVVVGSDVSGSVEDRVEHGRNGFAFSGGDAVALCKLLCEINAPTFDTQSVKAAARATAEEWPVDKGVNIVEENSRRILRAHGVPGV